MNKKISIKTIMIIILLCIIIALISVILSMKKENIEKEEISTIEQLTETTSDNAYVDMETHLNELAANANSLGLTVTKLKNQSYYNKEPTAQSFSYTFKADYDYALVMACNAASLSISSTTKKAITIDNSNMIFNLGSTVRLITKPLTGDTVKYTGGSGSSGYYQGLFILGLNIE